MSIQELTPKPTRLRPAEKAEVVRKLVQEIVNVWPGIEKTPGVVGGDDCIVRTRIPVWALVNYRRLGLSESQILANYPSLRAEDLVNAWAYAESHRKEIEKAIRENEEA